MKAEYYIPKTQTTWDLDDEQIVDEVSLLELIKWEEGVKRIPHTWIIRLEKDGKMIEVNRRAASRMKVIKEKAAKDAEKNNS